jgi:hypothetical protein
MRYGSKYNKSHNTTKYGSKSLGKPSYGSKHMHGKKEKVHTMHEGGFNPPQMASPIGTFGLTHHNC